MTLIAVACALRDKLVFPWAYGREVAVYGVCLAAVAIGAWWTINSTGRMFARVAGLTLLCLLAGWTMHAVVGVRNVSFYTLLTLIEALVICFGTTVCAGRLGLKTPLTLTLSPAKPGERGQSESLRDQWLSFRDRA
jgi:hypothetical protein